jgi:hypothetical protein
MIPGWLKRLSHHQGGVAGEIFMESDLYAGIADSGKD